MEAVFLIGGTASRQCERRTSAAIRNTETSWDVLHCATIGDTGSTGAGGTVDKEVLSARGKPLNLNWTHREIKRQDDVPPSELYGLEREFTARETLHLNCMGSVGG